MALQFTFDKSLLNSKPVALLNIFVIIYVISIIVRFFSAVGFIVFAGLVLYILFLIDQQFSNAWVTRQDLLRRIEWLESKLGVDQNTNSQNLEIN